MSLFHKIDELDNKIKDKFLNFFRSVFVKEKEPSKPLVYYFLSPTGLFVWNILGEYGKWKKDDHWLSYDGTVFESHLNLWISNGRFFLEAWGENGLCSTDSYEFSVLEKFILWSRVSKQIKYIKNEKNEKFLSKINKKGSKFHG